MECMVQQGEFVVWCIDLFHKGDNTPGDGITSLRCPACIHLVYGMAFMNRWMEFPMR